jgi:hypothetical protein
MILRGVCSLRTGEVDWLFTPQGGAAQNNTKAWNSFQEAVGVTATNQTQHQLELNVPDRTVLYEYYDRMFGLNTTNRWNAARSWMMYEYAISQTFREGSSESPDSPAVLVAPSDSEQLTYQDRQGELLSEHYLSSLDPPDVAGAILKQGLPHSSESTETPSLLQSRPIGMTTEDFIKAQDEQFGNFSGLPAMAMLTCYYSVNNQYAMNNLRLHCSARIDRIRHIPCIAVQGGKDPICPPDTALDLKREWPELELRIPMRAGHSMYHPELTHELVQATDRLAEL